jgi:hypothetical protein
MMHGLRNPKSFFAFTARVEIYRGTNIRMEDANLAKNLWGVQLFTLIV